MKVVVVKIIQFSNENNYSNYRSAVSLKHLVAQFKALNY